MTGKDQRDRERWETDHPELPEGWTRIPLKWEDEPFDALPDDVADEVDRPVLIEWRPSSIMGWARAAVWYGPVEDWYKTDKMDS